MFSHSVLKDFCFQHRFARSDAYSVRNDLTGLDSAALMAWKLTVINVIMIATAITSTKTPNPILIL